MRGLGPQPRGADTQGRHYGPQAHWRKLCENFPADVSLPAPYLRQGFSAGVSEILIGAFMARQMGKSLFHAPVIEGAQIHRCIMAVSERRLCVEQNADESLWLDHQKRSFSGSAQLLGS